MTAIHATMDDSWLQLDLTMAQLKGLMALADTSMTIGQIAEALNIGKPAASILVERLVQPGLAERAEDPQDRRRSIAQLTAQGAELVARLRQEGGQARFQGWIGQLADADLAALVRGMTALATVATRERQQVTAERTAARTSDLALAE